VTFTDLQGQSPTAGLFNVTFHKICAAADKVSSDIVHCAVSLQQLATCVTCSALICSTDVH